MPGVHTFVYQADGSHKVLRGFVTLAYLKAEESCGSVLEIMALAVQDKYQKQGIGTDLLDFAVHFLKASWPEADRGPKLRLSVASSNKARMFFQKFGFRIIGEGNWKYPAGQTALRMEYVI